MTHLRAVYAHVAQPNTPETDAQPKVMHTVKLSDGTFRQIMATDPMNAIDLINGVIAKKAGDLK